MADEIHNDAAHTTGLLRFRGADTIKFLQGQLSNDMALLRADHVTLAGLHNPQGRVLALLRLAAHAPDHVIALLPAELAETTMATLRRYVLRAKVTISNDSSADTLAAVAAQLPVLAPSLARTAHALNVAAGMPQVYAATSGMFVAQMLNLDCIDAISYSKGCYTGQEIIARAHYRGRMKRRMQRFVTNVAAVLAPGQAVTLRDGRGAQIVDAVTLPDGRSEFLAVAPLATHSAALGTSAAGGSPHAAGEPLACTPLPLPYVLPE